MIYYYLTNLLSLLSDYYYQYLSLVSPSSPGIESQGSLRISKHQGVDLCYEASHIILCTLENSTLRASALAIAFTVNQETAFFGI